MALNKKQNNNLSFILTKLLLTIIIILGSFIYVNWNEKNKSYFKKYVIILKNYIKCIQLTIAKIIK